MSIFHKHKWREVGRSYTGPDFAKVRRLQLLEGAVPDRLIFGFTSVEMRCDGCGALRFVTKPGTK